MNEYLTHYLYPGALYASSRPTIVTTVLGSCVGVCLFDPYTKIGGINHFMLPLWNGEGLASPKYGNIAIKKLIEKMLSLGCLKPNLRAKVFGGGEVIDTQMANFHIGERNIELAYQILEEEKIPIVIASVGGLLGRKIIFTSDTAAVQHRFIERQISAAQLEKQKQK